MTMNISLSNDKNRLMAQDVASLDDKQLKKLAVAKTNYEERTSKTNKLSNAALALFPIADTFAVGVLSGETLGQKATAGVARAGNWAAILGAGAVTATAAHAVFKNSPALSKFSQKHPVLTQLLFMTGTVGAAITAVSLLDKLKTKLISQSSVEKIQASINKLPKAEKLNAKVLDKLRPILGNKIVRNASALAVIALIMKPIFDLSTYNSKVENNYNKLKELRAQVSEDLDI